MIDINKKYRTRDGREVRIYSTDGGGSFPIHGAIKLSDDKWTIATWRKDGLKYEELSSFDLFEVKPRHKVTALVNTYCSTISEGLYFTKEDADKSQAPSRTGCIKIEIDLEEGKWM
jgi:hypothetical protein